VIIRHYSSTPVAAVSFPARIMSSSFDLSTGWDDPRRDCKMQPITRRAGGGLDCFKRRWDELSQILAFWLSLSGRNAARSD